MYDYIDDMDLTIAEDIDALSFSFDPETIPLDSGIKTLIAALRVITDNLTDLDVAL